MPRPQNRKLQLAVWKKRKENARRPAGKPVPGLCLSCLTVIFQGPASQTDARVSKRRDNQCKEESDATHLSPANTPRCSTVLMMIAFLVLQLKMSNIPLWCLSRNHATDWKYLGVFFLCVLVFSPLKQTIHIITCSRMVSFVSMRYQSIS